MTINEVAPPGFGHTKGDKEKGVKRGGTAAAFDRARKEGRFKGSKSDMFAIMWSQKNKGDKPHYKPGTDKKYKKYQDESFEIDKTAHKAAQKKQKMRNLAKGNTNPNEKAAAEKKAGGPKLIGEKEEITKADLYKAYSKGMKMMSGTKEFKAHQEKISKMRKALKMNEGKKWDSYKKAVATVLGKKKEQRTAQKAMDAGARLRRKKQRQEYAAKVSGSEDLVPDDIRD